MYVWIQIEGVHLALFGMWVRTLRALAMISKPERRISHSMIISEIDQNLLMTKVIHHDRWHGSIRDGRILTSFISCGKLRVRISSITGFWQPRPRVISTSEYRPLVKTKQSDDIMLASRRPRETRRLAQTRNTEVRPAWHVGCQSRKSLQSTLNTQNSRAPNLLKEAKVQTQSRLPRTL